MWLDAWVTILLVEAMRLLVVILLLLGGRERLPVIPLLHVVVLVLAGIGHFTKVLIVLLLKLTVLLLVVLMVKVVVVVGVIMEDLSVLVMCSNACFLGFDSWW